MALVVKNLPTSAGDITDMDLIPGSERSPGGRHGKSLQDSCLQNPMDRGLKEGCKESDLTEAT